MVVCRKMPWQVAVRSSGKNQDTQDTQDTQEEGVWGGKEAKQRGE